MAAMPHRRILHIDMDAFFAAVEVVRDPSLRGKPLIIGGDADDRRGVVSTASYEARVYGVRSAMPLAEARRRCPHGIYMRGNFAHYRAASEKVREVLHTVSPLVEYASIDEAYIDVTGSQRLFGGDDAIAAYIKREIRARTELPCTIAITPNKLVSKIASDEAKPDGYLRIDAGSEAAFLRPLPLRKLPGVGPRTGRILESLGVQTIGDLADLPEARLLRAFGPGGYGLQRAARGISMSEVVPDAVPKSISRETTFEEDVLDWERVERTLTYLTERAMHNLRENGLETKCVTLKVRYTDFETKTFAQSLPEPIAIDHDVFAVLQGLVPKAKERHARVRLIGVALTNLSWNQHQLRLFGGEGARKWAEALRSVDAIRSRHGFGAIRTAKTMPLGRDVGLSNPSLSR